MLFSFVRISYNKQSCGLLRWVPFIKATLGVVALITLAWLGHVIWRYVTISFLYVFSPSLVVIVFLEVALWRFNKLCDHVHIGMASFYSHMYSNQVLWLQSSGKLGYNILNSPCDHMIKDHATPMVVHSFILTIEFG